MHDNAQIKSLKTSVGIKDCTDYAWILFSLFTWPEERNAAQALRNRQAASHFLSKRGKYPAACARRNLSSQSRDVSFVSSTGAGCGGRGCSTSGARFRVTMSQRRFTSSFPPHPSTLGSCNPLLPLSWEHHPPNFQTNSFLPSPVLFFVVEK